MTPDKPPLALVGTTTQPNATPNRGGSSSPSSRRRLEALEKRRQVVQLRLYGHTFQAIADKLGYSGRQAAEKAFRAGLEQWGRKDVEEAVAAEEARLDEALRIVAPQMAKGNLFAVDRFLAISRDRRKLLGLDKPVQVEMTALVAEVRFEPTDNPRVIEAGIDFLALAAGRDDQGGALVPGGSGDAGVEDVETG